MRLNTSTQTLFAVSSLFSLGSSLPFFARNAVWLEPLVRRATYSVVAVDGGAAATGADGQVGTTIIQTVTQTPAPATKTIIETDTPPTITDYIISTKTIQGSDTVQTSVVTLTSSPATVTTTRYSIIDVNSPPVTIVVSVPASSSSSLSSSSAAISTTSSSSSLEISSVSATFSSLNATSSTTSSSSISTSNSTSKSATFVTSVSVFAPTTTSSITHSYDNGQWHTSYPAWSNTTSTSTTSQPGQTTSPVAATTPTKALEESTPPAVSGGVGNLGKRGAPAPNPIVGSLRSMGAVGKRGLRRTRS